jgi:C4-dicarboxylate transporter, DctM subunit
MSPVAQGLIILIVTLVVLTSGMPVAFGLGSVAIFFLVLFHGTDALQVVAETFYASLDDFTLVSIPMFIMMGAAIGSSPAGKDLYEALDRWLYRFPGGLVISNLGACAIFSALSGSSPATCAAIGKMGIPEMRKRGYPKEIAAGSIAAGGTLGILIPPSITFILYGIATETSIGRLFLAGVLPGMMLTGLFILWTLIAMWKSGFRSHAPDFRYSWKEKFHAVPKVAPFVLIVIGVVYALYGGIATPSEAAGVGAALCVVMAILIYRMWRPREWVLILRDTTREAVMILMIIAASVLFGYMLSSLYLTQTLAHAIADSEVNRWVLMAFINLFLLVAGFFIPPAAVILMTAPILLPIVTTAGFDPIWFGVVLTINMEIGLITPPVGLNLYVINGIAPDVTLQQILRGSLPYMLCMVLGIVILCAIPGIATWLPDILMGPVI